jgi:hypothetical protein
MWKAEFNDNTILQEIDELGRERSFGDVLKRVTELTKLAIIMGNKQYSVKLNDGKFSILTGEASNDFYTLDTDVYNIDTLENIRPIYFVRETVKLSTSGSNGKGENCKVNFVALGFQASYNGKNIKRYLAIFPDGQFIVKDN